MAESRIALLSGEGEALASEEEQARYWQSEAQQARREAQRAQTVLDHYSSLETPFAQQMSGKARQDLAAAEQREALAAERTPALGRQASEPAAPVAPAEPAEPQAPGTTAQRYQDARTDWRQYRSIFGDKTPTSRVLARGPYGAGHQVPDEDVARQFFNKGRGAASDAANYVAAIGDQEDARALLAEYAARDLKARATNPDGTINPGKWRGWVDAHTGPLAALGLTKEFGSVPAAAERLADLRADRADLDAQFSNAMGPSDSAVMGRYFRQGPAGADAMRAYIRETGGTPEAMQAMQDHIADSLIIRAAKTGEISPGAYKTWEAAHRSALSAIPDIAARFGDAGAAQEAAERAIGQRLDALKSFERSAARFWLRGDPETAIARALARNSTNDPAATMADLGAAVGDDPAALAGLRRGIGDYIGNHVLRPGRDGADRLNGEALANLLHRDRAALAKVLTPEQMSVLDRIAVDARRDTGPAAAQGKMRSWFSRLAPEIIAHGSERLLTHAGAWALGFHLDGPMGAVIGEGVLRVVRALMESRINSVGALVDRMLLDPAFAREMFQRVSSKPAPALSARVARNLIRSSAVMASTQAPVQQRNRYARGGAVNFLGNGPLDQMNRTIGKLATPGGMLSPNQRLF